MIATTVMREDCAALLGLCQVLENAESLQTAYARFPLLCTPSQT